MKKLLLLPIIFLATLSSQSQELTYGFVTGVNLYDIETQGGSFVNNESAISYNFGGFLDYQLNDSFGLKGNLIYSAANEMSYVTRAGYVYSEPFDIKVKSLQFIPHLKFDFNKEYNKGFYLFIGPRISFVLGSKDEDGNKIENFYKATNFGAQLGFGFHFLKHFALEIVGDYGLSDTLDNNTETQTGGGYINLNINIESILNN
ncbi:porin family protein [Winogradskyella pacifica]|uniref:porin family protein n=1 Tax=Winogradskyella pacifica TaxID=664642 RepID=UPI0015C69BE8|nr:porin family protein [Winogradskyella pacifica]